MTPAVYQANSLDDFLKIAFDVKQLQRDDGEYHFNLPENQRILSYGAKVLVAGNDSTMYQFVQEYV